jgi:hypothetical protein
MTFILSPLTGVTGCKCSAAIFIVRSSSFRNTEHIPKNSEVYGYYCSGIALIFGQLSTAY